MIPAVLGWHLAGFSTIPIRPDGTKRPTIAWASYQQAKPTDAEVKQWFSVPGVGVAVICGQVSGNLEMTELEARASDADSLTRIADACLQHGVLDLWETLLSQGYAEWTPSGGIHLLYRVSGANVPGNTKLAENRRRECLAETRGEGGYVIVAPSNGTVHPTGEAWSVIAGAIGAVPTITWEDRCAIHAAITQALDESTPTIPPQQRPATLLAPGTLRPGDDFNVRGDWDAILTPHGWQAIGHQGQETLWARPGKNPRDGHSASTGYADDADRMYVWSTSAGLPTEQPLTKFFVYAALNHGGDFAATARDLGAMGYGTPLAERETFADLIGRPAAPMVAPEVFQPQIVARRWDDVGNADRLLDRHGGVLRWVDERGAWTIYDGRHWATLSGQTVPGLAVELVKRFPAEEAHLYPDDPIPTPKGADGASQREKFLTWAAKQGAVMRVRALVELASADPRMQISVAEFDSDPMLLNCPNGVVNLRTGELEPHNSRLLLSQIAAVDYRPGAQAPRWWAFLARVLPALEDRLFLQRAVGYSLTGLTTEQAMFIHHGSGANGKSVFLEVMGRVVGTYGQVMPRSTLLTKQSESVPTDIARMRGKRFLQTAESAQGRRLDEEVVKGLTGGEEQSARFLHQNFFDFKPTGKIHYATNHLPKVTDAESIWRRLQFIAWTVVIPPAERDPHLSARLINDEAPGILAWAVQGALDWGRDGLAPPKSAVDRLNAYRRDEDILADFIEDGLAVDGEGRITNQQLYISYQAWSKQNGVSRPYTLRMLLKAMREKGFVQWSNGAERGLIGIRALPAHVGWLGAQLWGG